MNVYTWIYTWNTYTYWDTLLSTCNGLLATMAYPTSERLHQLHLPNKGLYQVSLRKITRSPLPLSSSSSWDGVINLSHWCVPTGSNLVTYSASNMAVMYEKKVLLMVVNTPYPPGWGWRREVNKTTVYMYTGWECVGNNYTF